ncbi:MAG: NADH-ubiquinone oxidoreductase-F iron-sulfur binding region domain-containing protein, partial [Coriobacteriales bacterium]
MSMISIDERSKADAKIAELSEAYARRVEAMPPGTCPIAVQAGLLETCAAQTCGKCTPCREGIPRIKALLEKVLRYEADESTVAEIAKRARLLRDTADCAVGYDAGAQVLQGLEA